MFQASISGPCTWRCTSGEGMGEPLRSGQLLVPRPVADCLRAAYSSRLFIKSAHAREAHPPGQPVTPPPWFYLLRVSRGTPGPDTLRACPSSSVRAREPSVATPAPADLAALVPHPPRPADLWQLLRVGHGDLHAYLLHDRPGSGFPPLEPRNRADRPPWLRKVNRTAAACAGPLTPEVRCPRSPTGNGVQWVGAGPDYNSHELRETSRAREENGRSRIPVSNSGLKRPAPPCLGSTPKGPAGACTLDDGRVALRFADLVAPGCIRGTKESLCRSVSASDGTQEN